VPHVGVGLQNLAGQSVLLGGIMWGATVGAPADKANLILSIICERGLILGGPLTGASFNLDEDVFDIVLDGSITSTRFDGYYDFTTPVELEPGNTYGIVMTVSQRASISGNVDASLTVFGRQISQDRRGFPFIYR